MVVGCFHVAELYVSPLPEFLVMLDPFSHRSRSGLRCDVPPGLPGTRT
jgi:hypothetical protein